METVEYTALIVTEMANVAAKYRELRTQMELISSERRQVEHRLKVLAELIRSEGGECRFPWDRD